MVYVTPRPVQGKEVSHAVAPSGGSVRVGEWPTMDFALRNGVPSMRFETHAAGARLLPIERLDRKPQRMQATRRARHSQRLLPLGRLDRKPKRMQATRRARHSQG